MGIESDILKQEIDTAYVICDKLMVIKKIDNSIALILHSSPPFETVLLTKNQTRRLIMWILRELGAEYLDEDK